MKLEPNPLLAPTATALPAGQAKLSPELEQLLERLQLTVGSKVEATISKVTAVSAQQQLALAAHKAEGLPAAERSAWRPLLAQSALQLVEIKLDQGSFSAVTHLPLKVNQAITLVMTPKGAQLVLTPQVHPSGPATAANPTVARSLGASVASPATEFAQLRPQPAPLASQIARAMPGMTQSLSTTATSSHAVPFRTAAQPPPQSLQQGQALATAVATALPKAQSASVMLGPSTKLLSLLQHVPVQTLPPALRPLVPLLALLEAQSLPVTSSKPMPAETIARAINNNGVFHERNALQSLVRAGEQGAPEKQEADIKALLIRTVDSMTQLSPPSIAQAARPNLTNDAVARLWFGLLRAAPKPEMQPAADSSRENLLQLAQTMAEKSLAKIQLNQYRSLPSGADSANASPVVHLDIPLKWPDGYANAYLQIFPPPEDKDKAREQEQSKRKRMRWRIYMQMELGVEGELAVELSVAEERVDATFWAEKDSLRRKAAAQIQHLRNNLTSGGLEVNELRCSDSPPPEKKIKLDYALIDVRT